VFSVAGEGGLRLDYCERCRGYLKTYDGQGNEDVLLANWTSIHLDILAQDRQLNAFSETVYQLE
jgi:FdhE protein